MDNLNQSRIHFLFSLFPAYTFWMIFFNFPKYQNDAQKTQWFNNKSNLDWIFV